MNSSKFTFKRIREMRKGQPDESVDKRKKLLASDSGISICGSIDSLKIWQERKTFVSDSVGINPEGAQKVETSSKTICILYPWGGLSCSDWLKCSILVYYWLTLITRNCSEWRDCWSGILWKYEGLELYLLFVWCQTWRKYRKALIWTSNICLSTYLLIFSDEAYLFDLMKVSVTVFVDWACLWYSPHHK